MDSVSDNDIDLTNVNNIVDIKDMNMITHCSVVDDKLTVGGYSKAKVYSLSNLSTVCKSTASTLLFT